MRWLRSSICAVLWAGLALPVGGQHAEFDTNPLVGTWERVSLLRNAVSVQPPDSPLYIKIGSDGYFSMMEAPDDRKKVDKPLDQMTREELLNRFDKVEGGWGHYLVKRDLLNRIHRGDISPAREGVSHIREYVFEGEIMNLVGTGPTRSPQARMRRLPAQPLSDKRLVGTWERTSLMLNGQPAKPAAPEVILLGEDGWFAQSQTPTGRKVLDKQLKDYAKEDFVAAFTGVEAARGTYSVEGSKFSRKHVANINPNYTGREEVREFTLQGSTLTLRGTDMSGKQVEAQYKRLEAQPILTWSIGEASTYDLTPMNP